MKAEPWFRRRRRLTLVGIVLIGTVAIDLTSAVVLRACGLRALPRDPDAHYRRGHDVYHHTLKENVSFDAARWGSLVFPIRTNSLGFRDREVREVDVAAAGPRILLIGDSFTEGIGLPYEETFAGMLDQRLRPRGVEVLNAGVVSYAPTIYLQKVRHLVEHEQLRFDHLIVFIDLSDIEDEVDRYGIEPEGGQVVNQADAGFDEQLKHFVAEHTILLNAARQLVRRVRVGADQYRNEAIDDQLNHPRGLWAVDPEVFARSGEAGLAAATQRMDALAAFVSARQIELTVVVYPWPAQIERRDLESKQVTHWRAWAERHGAGFVNCFPAFIDERPARDVIAECFIPGDVHYTREGHAVIAECVMERLRPR